MSSKPNPLEAFERACARNETIHSSARDMLAVRPCRVLVIEDDQKTQDAYAAALRGQAVVRAALTPEAAARELGANPFDLVISCAEGLGPLRAFRLENAVTPIVVIAEGRPSPLALTGVLAEGVYEKPVGDNDLRDIVAKYAHHED